MLKGINTYFINAGNGLLSRIKYDFIFSYDSYDLLVNRFKKKRILNSILCNKIYNL